MAAVRKMCYVHVFTGAKQNGLPHKRAACGSLQTNMHDIEQQQKSVDCPATYLFGSPAAAPPHSSGLLARRPLLGTDASSFVHTTGTPL